MRHCCNCQTPIYGCNGFIKAGDMLEFQDGLRAGKDIRELCGKCALRLIVAETSEEMMLAVLDSVGCGPSQTDSSRPQ